MTDHTCSGDEWSAECAGCQADAAEQDRRRARALIFVVCSFCQRVVRPWVMMGRMLRDEDGRFKSATHGAPGVRCPGSRRGMESVSNMRLSVAQRAELDAMTARKRD